MTGVIAAAAGPPVASGRAPVEGALEAAMADRQDERETRVPLMQTVFDNVFLLVVIGLAVPIVFYTVWGLLEIASIPLAR